jgi:deazaflavin-dependent oxidoreductase (nitroreductase family)
MPTTQLTERRHGVVLRWMYRTGHPNRVAALMNRTGAILGSVGVWPDRLVTLEVHGRRTGRLITLPLVVAHHRGQRYLVAMLGERTGWVANVRAAHGRVILHHGDHEVVRLVEVPAAARAPILREYLRVAPGARPHIPVDRAAPLADFAAVSDRYPVFLVVPWRHPGVAAGA